MNPAATAAPNARFAGQHRRTRPHPPGIDHRTPPPLQSGFSRDPKPDRRRPPIAAHAAGHFDREPQPHRCMRRTPCRSGVSRGPSRTDAGRRSPPMQQAISTASHNRPDACAAPLCRSASAAAKNRIDAGCRTLRMQQPLEPRPATGPAHIAPCMWERLPSRRAFPATPVAIEIAPARGYRRGQPRHATPFQPTTAPRPHRSRRERRAAHVCL